MKFRNPLKITSRTSSITNSFVQAIIPSYPPTSEARHEALAVLGMSDGKIECIYCGSAATDWDHLHPLVRNKQPTGYINEMKNLVPSCAPCNQSKSGSDWKRWMTSAAIGSPTTRRIANLADRIRRLDEFVAWGGVKPLPLRDLAGPTRWDKYWEHLGAIEKAMVEAQMEAVEVQTAIRQSLRRSAGDQLGNPTLSESAPSTVRSD